MAVKGSTGHRQRQAEATKREVARVARALFAEHGYVATTISAISAEADIPVQTIYSAFGSKAKILDKITELWMSETQTTSRAAAYLQEPDPAQQLRMLAELNRRQMQVGSDVVAIYQEAAASDPQMAETLRNVLASREREIRKLIDALAPRLRSDLTVDSALDLTLALTLPELFHLLVVERGWGPLRYETWLADTLVANSSETDREPPLGCLEAPDLGTRMEPWQTKAPGEADDAGHRTGTDHQLPLTSETECVGSI